MLPSQTLESLQSRSSLPKLTNTPCGNLHDWFQVQESQNVKGGLPMGTMGAFAAAFAACRLVHRHPRGSLSVGGGLTRGSGDQCEAMSLPEPSRANIAGTHTLLQPCEPPCDHTRSQRPLVAGVEAQNHAGDRVCHWKRFPAMYGIHNTQIHWPFRSHR